MGTGNKGVVEWGGVPRACLRAVQQRAKHTARVRLAHSMPARMAGACTRQAGARTRQKRRGVGEGTNLTRTRAGCGHHGGGTKKGAHMAAGKKARGAVEE